MRSQLIKPTPHQTMLTGYDDDIASLERWRAHRDRDRESARDRERGA